MDSWRHLRIHLLPCTTLENEGPPAAMATKQKHHLLFAAAATLVLLLLPSGSTATAVEYCSKRD